jgi:thioredoxin 1
MLGPILEETARELGDGVRVGKVDVDKCPDVAARFGVRSIPALFVLKDGQVVDSMVGLQSKSALVNAVQRHL